MKPALALDPIHSINSLIGITLPSGLDRTSLKVALENLAAWDVQPYQIRVATTLM